MPQNSILYNAYLLAIAYLFFGYCWTRGGQTVGMKAWRLKLVQDNDDRVTWAQAAMRLIGAILSWGCLGLGYIWMYISKDGRSWHDKLSDTKIVILPKKAKS